jgi:soluble lytic murein transglycosylase-like protein
MPINFVDAESFRPQAPSLGPALRWLRQAAGAFIFAAGTFSVVAFAALLLVPTVRDTALAGVVQLLEPEADAADAAVADAEDVDSLRIGREVALDPGYARVAQYLSRRYHVADNAARVVVAVAVRAGREQRVDAQLILAVAAVESSLNPFAQSPVGATGLMQVMPALHEGKFSGQTGRRGALDPIANIRVGSEILGDLIRRGGSVERGLQLYVGAGNLSDDGGYPQHVLTELSRIRTAAQGDVAGALAAAQRGDPAASGT